MVWEAAYDALSAGIHADLRNIGLLLKDTTNQPFS